MYVVPKFAAGKTVKDINERKMIDPKMAYDLLKAQNDLIIASRLAHWNVRGPNFGETHEIFGQIYEVSSAKVDTLVEIFRALGYSPSFDEFAGPSGQLMSFAAEDLVEMLIGYATTYLAALVRLRDRLREEPMATGLVNLLEQLCEETTGTTLFLLSASQGR